MVGEHYLVARLCPVDKVRQLSLRLHMRSAYS